MPKRILTLSAATTHSCVLLICGRRRVAVALYRMICLVLVDVAPPYEFKPILAIHGGCRDCSRALGITSGFYGLTNTHRGTVISVMVTVYLLFCILHFLNALYGMPLNQEESKCIKNRKFITFDFYPKCKYYGNPLSTVNVFFFLH